MIRCQDCRVVVELVETEAEGQLEILETPEGPTLLRGPGASDRVVVCCGPAGHRLEAPPRTPAESWVPPWTKGT